MIRLDNKSIILDYNYSLDIRKKLKMFWVFVVLFLVCSVDAHPSKYFNKLERANGNDKIQFIIALKQNEQGKENLKKLLAERSDPKSPMFSQWLQKNEILDLVRPKSRVVKRMKTKLEKMGVRVLKDFQDSLLVETSVKAVEALFSTKVHHFESKSNKKKRVTKAVDYKLPQWMIR